MRRIQITQWSGSRACNLLAKIEFRCGWLSWREWDCVGALLGRSAADHVAATRAHPSRAVSASCHCNQNFCPPSGSDTHLQVRRAPRSAATWVDVIMRLPKPDWLLAMLCWISTRFLASDWSSSYQHTCIWVRSRNCGCLVTWFCYQLIAKPGNKTAAVPWPDPYADTPLIRLTSYLMEELIMGLSMPD